jgi:hypothetical protein
MCRAATECPVCALLVSLARLLSFLPDGHLCAGKQRRGAGLDMSKQLPSKNAFVIHAFKNSPPKDPDLPRRCACVGCCSTLSLPCFALVRSCDLRGVRMLLAVF